MGSAVEHRRLLTETARLSSFSPRQCLRGVTERRGRHARIVKREPMTTAPSGTSFESELAELEFTK